ncbi:MAG: putative lipid II flippase FtsW [Candidatus Yanofskybacteria bacterium]|nr:putative lipid II flippase FtsW [Candidatus Yanofskybacteria bacterium]
MERRLLFITLILLVFGLIVLSSAGIVEGQKKFGSSYYYLSKQILYGVLPGLLLFFLFSKIDYRFWKKTSFIILFGSLLLMILVFVPDIGIGLKGANRWVSLWGVSFQPSEILKLAMVMYLAAWFGSRDERLKNWSYSVAPFFVVISFIGLLLALQPDVGTLAVVVLIALGIYFAAGLNLKHLLVIVAIFVVTVAGLIFIEPYRLNRIKTFFDPSVDPRGISYQLNQSLIAIGSGGLFGNGYNESTQKWGFLPEVVNDSIFAVVAEELGFVGAMVLVGLFVYLSYILISIAKLTFDKFGRLLVIGMSAWIVGQAFINIAAVSGLAPLTGIPLPFISHGGTAIIALLAGLGIVYNIAKKT